MFGRWSKTSPPLEKVNNNAAKDQCHPVMLKSRVMEVTFENQFRSVLLNLVQVYFHSKDIDKMKEIKSRI